MSFPEWLDNIGKRAKFKHPDGTEKHGVIVDEIRHQQSGSGGRKIVYLQKIQYDDDGQTELRLTYYVIGKKERMEGRWVFGQFSTLLPAEDFKTVVDEAKARGWI